MPPAADSAILHQILQQLGSISATQQNLSSQFAEEARQTRESRKAMHEKDDDLNERVGRGEGDSKVLGAMIKQTRDHVDDVQRTVHAAVEEVKTDLTDAVEDVRSEVVGRVVALEGKISKEISPLLEDWKRARNIGYGIAGLIALSGLSVGAAFIWAGQTVLDWLRAVLLIK